MAMQHDAVVAELRDLARAARNPFRRTVSDGA
jgi:hypothetical protein